MSTTKMTFQICFVYDEEVDYTLLRKLCEQHGIKYKARSFNSSRYVMDRENIVRLPAIHIIESEFCLETVYPSIRALDAVEYHYTHYNIRQERKYKTWKRIGRWLFGRDSLKTDSPLTRSVVSTN